MNTICTFDMKKYSDLNIESYFVSYTDVLITLLSEDAGTEINIELTEKQFKALQKVLIDVEKPL